MHFSILSLSGHSSPWQNLQNLIDLVLSPRPVNLQGKNHIKYQGENDLGYIQGHPCLQKEQKHTKANVLEESQKCR
jgi:hypothetical protein